MARITDQLREHEAEEWRDMASAPRDGTMVELRCTAGVAPWYGRFRWTRESHHHYSEGRFDPATGQRPRYAGTKPCVLDSPTWVSVDEMGIHVSKETDLQWRPTSAGEYTDPTGGAQHTKEYWDGG